MQKIVKQLLSNDFNLSVFETSSKIDLYYK